MSMATRELVSRPLDIERLERLIEDMAEAHEHGEEAAFVDSMRCIRAEIRTARAYEIRTKGGV